MEAANRTYHEAQSQMEYLPNYYRWTYRYILPYVTGKVIELGCGAGIGIRYYIDKATDIIAVDYNPDLLTRVKAVYPSEKVTTQALDLTDDWKALDGAGADLVIMMDVLEHFQDDALFLRRAIDCLRPGGKVAFKVPAQSDLYGEIDQASGHYRRYDKGDVERLAQELGVSLLSLKSINPVGAMAYKRKRHEKKNFSKTFSPAQLKLINLAIPPLTLLDHLPGLPGQSFVAVFEKPV